MTINLDGLLLGVIILCGIPTLAFVGILLLVGGHWLYSKIRGIEDSWGNS